MLSLDLTSPVYTPEVHEPDQPVVRRAYVHKTCDGVTIVQHGPIAEALNRKPQPFSLIFCQRCVDYLPPWQFLWYGTGERVGDVQ